MEEREEEWNKRKGAIVSIVIHALLLVLFAFMLAWREPDPPLPEYGIEINFGLDQTGSGDVQPRNPVTPQAEEEDPATEEPAEVEEQEVIEEIAEPVTEEVIEEAVEEIPAVENTQESPEVIKEQPKKSETPKTETKPTPKKETEQVKEEPKKESPKPVQETPKKTTGNNGEGDKPAAESSQGDDRDAEGDKGNEQGELDARALYGKPGGGQGGPALNIVGWIWDDVPDKKDASSENGTITFKFTIDEEGYVIRILTVKRSVSPSVAKFYEDQLRKTTFSRTGSGAVKPGNTEGTVTFTIVSK